MSEDRERIVSDDRERMVSGYGSFNGRFSNSDSDNDDKHTPDPIPNGQVLRSPASMMRNEGYVELMRGNVPCPTCRGVGSVSKEQENELVALIPLKDERLKPRRTWIYVAVAIVVCLLAAGLLIFFMFPRDVTLTNNINLLLPSNLTINIKEKSVTFCINNKFNVSNSNYFEVQVTDATMSVVFAGKVLNSTIVQINKNVPVRSVTSFSIPLWLAFNKENGLGELAGTLASSIFEVFVTCFKFSNPPTNRPMRHLTIPIDITDLMMNIYGFNANEDCASPYSFYHQRTMHFMVTASYKFLNKDEEASLDKYTSVSCGNDTSLSTDKYIYR